MDRMSCTLHRPGTGTRWRQSMARQRSCRKRPSTRNTSTDECLAPRQMLAKSLCVEEDATPAPPPTRTSSCGRRYTVAQRTSWTSSIWCRARPRPRDGSGSTKSPLRRIGSRLLKRRSYFAHPRSARLSPKTAILQLACGRPPGHLTERQAQAKSSEHHSQHSRFCP